MDNIVLTEDDAGSKLAESLALEMVVVLPSSPSSRNLGSVFNWNRAGVDVNDADRSLVRVIGNGIAMVEIVFDGGKGTMKPSMFR